MAIIIQFMHPGQEHPYNTNEHMKPKNTKTHKRNFICTTGNYIDKNEKLHKSEQLAFWGEWENEATVIKNYNSEKPFPKALISPKVPDSNPANIDPFVFGERFKYFWCQQRQIGKMKKLEKGDIILFGSNLNQKFVLDTVFVVKDKVSYKYPNEFDKIKKMLSKEDFDLFLKCSLSFKEYDCEYDGCASKNKTNQPCSDSCNKKEEKSNDFERTFYIGATYEDRNEVNGMYSFVPTKKNTDCEAQGFARIALQSDSGINLEISDNLSQNYKINELEGTDTTKIWTSIKNQVLNEGCLLGVQFSL